jgi:hypothetical protein
MRGSFFFRLICILPVFTATACSMYINAPKIEASNADPSFAGEIKSLTILSTVADPSRGPGFGESLSRGYQEAATRCNVTATVFQMGEAVPQNADRGAGQADAVLGVIRMSVLTRTTVGQGFQSPPIPVMATYQATLAQRASRREIWKAELKVAYPYASGPRAAEAGDVADVLFRRLAQDGVLRNCSFPPKR